jgi:hypothetical protein
MKKELELQLVKKYPIIFKDYGGDMRNTCMSWGLECGDGWYNLIDELCENVMTLIGDKDIKVTAAQVKEKFGGLRFYYDIESPETFIGNIDYRISRFMFKLKWGQIYWKIQDFRKKFYKTLEEKIRDAISNGEDKSYDTCEICGEPGETRGRGWISTQCDKCWETSKLNR